MTVTEFKNLLSEEVIAYINHLAEINRRSEEECLQLDLKTYEEAYSLLRTFETEQYVFQIYEYRILIKSKTINKIIRFQHVPYVNSFFRSDQFPIIVVSTDEGGYLINMKTGQVEG